MGWIEIVNKLDTKFKHKSAQEHIKVHWATGKLHTKNVTTLKGFDANAFWEIMTYRRTDRQTTC